MIAVVWTQSTKFFCTIPVSPVQTIPLPTLTPIVVCGNHDRRWVPTEILSFILTTPIWNIVGEPMLLKIVEFENLEFMIQSKGGEVVQ